MSADWTLTLDVGALHLEESRAAGRVPLVAGSPRICDGLKAGWTMTDDGNGLWPTQPPPMTCRFSLVASDVAELTEVTIGATVFCEAYAGVLADDDTPLPSMRFAGRVADLTARPVHVSGFDGWQVDVVCADYTADLAETDVAGSDPLQGVGVYTKVRNLFALADLPEPDWADGGTGAEQLTLDGGEIRSQSLSDAVDAYLRTYADGGPLFGADWDRDNHVSFYYQGWRRGIVRQKLAADPADGLDPVTPYRIEWVTARHTSPYQAGTELPTFTAYPARLDETEFGGYGAVIAHPPEHIAFDLSSIVSADYVDFDSQLHATKATGPTRVIVTNNTPADLAPTWRKVSEFRRPADFDPKVVRVTDCRAVNAHNAYFVAEMYLSDIPYGAMAPDRFRWYASLDPSWPHATGWFPDLGAGLWPGHAHPVVIDGLPLSQAPKGAGRRFHAGILTSAEWGFQRGDFYLDFSLRPGPPRPFNTGFFSPGSITFADLEEGAAAPFDGSLAIEDLHPTQSLADWRLIRTPRVDHPDLYPI